MKLEKIVKHAFWYFPYDARKILFSLVKHKKHKKYRFKINNIDQDGYSFRGFYEHKMIFVHIPKSGGMSINKSLSKNLGGGHIPVKNYQLFMNKSDFKTFFKFTVVRNPWDRAYSAYNFLKLGGITENDRKFAQENILPFKDFEDFVMNWLSHKNSRKGLHFIPQYMFICDFQGKVMVDYIGRFENLQADYKQICEKLGMETSPLKHINKSTSNGSYKDFYTTQMKERIDEVYAKDIRMFNYKF